MWTDLFGLGTQWTLPLALGLLFYVVLVVLAVDDAAAAREAQSPSSEPAPSAWVVTASYGLAIWPEIGEDRVTGKDSER